MNSTEVTKRLSLVDEDDERVRWRIRSRVQRSISVRLEWSADSCRRRRVSKCFVDNRRSEWSNERWRTEDPTWQEEREWPTVPWWRWIRWKFGTLRKSSRWANGKIERRSKASFSSISNSTQKWTNWSNTKLKWKKISRIEIDVRALTQTSDFQSIAIFHSAIVIGKNRIGEFENIRSDGDVRN